LAANMVAALIVLIILAFLVLTFLWTIVNRQ